MSISSVATFVARTALFAVALSACAHQSAQLSQTTLSYPGGRAAQPGGFIPSAQQASFEQAPSATKNGASYLGGQASEPHAWLDSQTPRVVLVETSCVAAGRAAQPFGGPSSYQTDGKKNVACHQDGATHF